MALGLDGWVANEPDGRSAASPRDRATLEAFARALRGRARRRRSSTASSLTWRPAGTAGRCLELQRPERRRTAATDARALERRADPIADRRSRDGWAIPDPDHRRPSLARIDPNSLPPRSCRRCTARSSIASRSSRRPGDRAEAGTHPDVGDPDLLASLGRARPARARPTCSRATRAVRAKPTRRGARRSAAVARPTAPP